MKLAFYPNLAPSALSFSFPCHLETLGSVELSIHSIGLDEEDASCAVVLCPVGP